MYDAVIIGSGPNGMAAAVRLALEGLSVKVIEGSDTIGGGTRTQELMRPGYFHDVCSAIHPMGMGSPFLKKLPLEKYGLEWIQPDYPMAHPLDDGKAVIQYRDLDQTAEALGPDARRYRRLIKPMVDNWEKMAPDLMAPLGFPANPVRLAAFGLNAVKPASLLASGYKTEEAKALFGGIAAHSILPLNQPLTSAIGLVLGAAGHAVGWPLPKKGSYMIAESMASYFRELGGEIETGNMIRSFDEIPPAKAVLFDLTPRQVLGITGENFPGRYRKKLENYKYGAGVFKIDYILKEPVPWANPECAKAGTVHVGGTFAELMESEKTMEAKRHAEKPYVLVAQQSNFDATRTPNNDHTLWAYCHVPSGSTKDMTEEIENQIERFAPGFRDVILEKHTMHAMDFQAYNPNYIGGDIIGGKQDIRQQFTRPVSWYKPYKTPQKGVYFCSSSAPPGGGVHGMCGFHAAELALRDEFGFNSRNLKFSI